MPIDDYRRDNLANWNDRVPIHTGPGGYDIDHLLGDPAALSPIVEFDRQWLGDVAGKTLLHLQCHIGTDTLSWARLGAEVTGLDFSAAALEEARALAAAMGVDGTFVEAEVYDAPEILGRTYDIVYTGIGAINWLPDVRRWAEVVAALLDTGGTFYIREGHPMYYAVDNERKDDALVVNYPYFETSKPISFDDPHTYAGGGTVEHARTHEWNHGLGETIQALIDAGLHIDHVGEYRMLDWQGLPHMEKYGDHYRLPEHQRDLLPLEFSIRATKPGT